MRKKILFQREFVEQTLTQKNCLVIYDFGKKMDKLPKKI